MSNNRFKQYRNSYENWDRAKLFISNGVLTLSKSPGLIAFGGCPVFVEKAKGAYFWDIDNNRYIDFPLSFGPIVLGHAYEEVDRVVKKQMEKGFLYSLSNVLELELAELLCEVIPSAEKVRFFKTGAEAVSAAVRVARAYTGKEMVADSGYHGWHDWSIVKDNKVAGVPSSLKELNVEFRYNDIEALERIFEQNHGKIAAVVLEPGGRYGPEKNFLEKVAELSRKNDAVLIFDEIVTGFRLSLGGAQSYFSVTPDISVFGKAMANGYPITVLAGKKDIMDAVEDKISLSSTYSGELLSIVAAIKTINILKDKKVNDYILDLGQRLKDGLTNAIEKHGISATCAGLHHKTILVFQDMGDVSAKILTTIFRQECLLRGVFLGYVHFTSFSHTREDIDYSIKVASEVFEIIRNGINQGNVVSLINCELSECVF